MPDFRLLVCPVILGLFAVRGGLTFYYCVFCSGRRVLNSYLLLFAHSATQNLSRTSQSLSSLDYDLIAYRALFTPFLGEKVGAEIDFEQSIIQRQFAVLTYGVQL